MLQVGNVSLGTVTLISPGTKWVLNTDINHIIGSLYAWDDTQTWTDANVWKDN
jgi:hypothetical protein